MKIVHRITANDAEVSRDGLLSLAQKIGWLVLLYRLHRIAEQKEEESPTEKLMRSMRTADAAPPKVVEQAKKIYLQQGEPEKMVKEIKALCKKAGCNFNEVVQQMHRELNAASRGR